MSMTRQHFEAIAETLKSVKPASVAYTDTKAQWERTVRAIAATLAAFNPGFRASRFYTACGIED